MGIWGVYRGYAGVLFGFRDESLGFLSPKNVGPFFGGYV